MLFETFVSGKLSRFFSACFLPFHLGSLDIINAFLCAVNGLPCSELIV